jgi:uncharacterized membrane protein YeiH
VLLTVLDLLGTFVFAISGALLAVRRELDLFGVVVLAGTAAFGGGVIRDVLLAQGPPRALIDSRYLVAAVAAAALVAAAAPVIARLGGTVAVFDAAGLGLFAVTGTRIALDSGLPAVPSIVLGVLTSVGGGIVRDILAGEVPLVLRREIYALAALLGAVLTVLGEAIPDVPAIVTGGVAAAATFTVRVLALRFGWHAPRGRAIRTDPDAQA